MSSSTHAIYSPRGSHGIADAAGHGFAQSVKGLWRAYWEYRARRTSIMYLKSLDSRTLSDIGLDRSEIESFVNDKTDQRLRRYDPSRG